MIKISVSFLFFFSFFITYNFAQINPDDITIIRDQWGVPHVYAKTDAQVAYGLAWASAEDDFETIQETLLPIRGGLGAVKGVEGAVLDFAAHLIEVNEIVDERYEAEISPKFKEILKAYAQGMNDFAEKYPKEILSKKMFPINGQDVIKGYTLALTLLSGLPGDLQKVVSGKMEALENRTPMGSNAFAVNSNKTKDGQTYLAINPHQPLEGPYSWYEAHLVSEEGMNVLGATLLGGMHVTVGANENLAWTHTVNHADFSDIYKLEMHKNEKNKYFFDGKWETLEIQKVKLKIKILGLKIGVKRKMYRSKHGPVLKSKNGNYYALKFTANQTIGGAEQWYMMNKAKNFDEFKSAVSRLGVCTTNLMYADNQDNIFYSSLGLFPKRNPNYDWKKVLPGYTSEVVWRNDFHLFEDIFQIENPVCGYLGNSNNTPFHSTAKEENIDPSTINSTFGYMTGDNNRSIRYFDLMKKEGKISYDDFKRIKMDTKWHTPAEVHSFPNLELLLNLDPNEYPDLAKIITHLNNWDRETDVESLGATIFNLSYHFIYKDRNKNGLFPAGPPLTELYLVERLKEVKKHLRKYFKSEDVPLGVMQKHIRGDKSIPIWGGPNVIAAMYGKSFKKGRFKIFAGESYVSLVRFTKDGVQIESIVPYGSSNDPDSPHFDDQMEKYSKQELKKMSLKKEDILKNATRTYHPK